jgi:hypothetical protein
MVEESLWLLSEGGKEGGGIVAGAMQVCKYRAVRRS